MPKKSYKDYVLPDRETKQTILHQAFEKQMKGGEPFGTIAIHLLNPKRFGSQARISLDQGVKEISQRISQGTHVVMSAAYLEASIHQLPDTQERAVALRQMYETGSPIAGLSPFSDLKND